MTDDRVQDRLDGEDADLFAEFQALRAADTARAPDADVLLGRIAEGAETRAGAGPATPGPRQRVPALWKLAVPLAAAAALLIVLRSDPDREFRRAVLAYSSSPALGAWTSPTDFLLRTPGVDLLRDLPQIGRTVPLTYPVPAPDPAPGRDTTIGG